MCDSHAAVLGIGIIVDNSIINEETMSLDSRPALRKAKRDKSAFCEHHSDASGFVRFRQVSQVDRLGDWMIISQGLTRLVSNESRPPLFAPKSRGFRSRAQGIAVDFAHYFLAKAVSFAQARQLASFCIHGTNL